MKFSCCFLIPVAALLAARGLAQDVEPPRLRTLLPNGSISLVENLPDAKVVSVQLFASSIRFRDTLENHGYKHLLEHLLLKGPNKDLDVKMESQGIFFTGRTLRDAMQIEFTCTSAQIPTVLDTLDVLMQPLQTSAKDIANEIKIMRQEQALEADSGRLGTAAWNLAYGDRGLSPFGDLETMSAATPQALQAFQSQLFSAPNLVLVISGPIDVELESKEGNTFLNQFSGSAGDEPDPMPAGTPGRVELDTAFGEARAARVGGFKEVKTAWALAAALALATQLGSDFVTYTPSAGNGLIILGKTDTNAGVGLKIDELEPGDLTALYPVGKSLAKRWIQRQLETPSASAGLRGLLLCQGPSYSPESMVQALDSMTWQQFFSAVALFNKENSDIVVGIR
jgi:predicted Zn-dependent peptidase